MTTKLLMTLAIALTLGTAAHGAVECKKEGRYWRPSNELAKKIADSLGVKTCQGDRFKEVVAKLGETSNVKMAPKKMSVDELVASLKKQ